MQGHNCLGLGCLAPADVRQNTLVVELLMPKHGHCNPHSPLQQWRPGLCAPEPCTCMLCRKNHSSRNLPALACCIPLLSHDNPAKLSSQMDL